MCVCWRPLSALPFPTRWRWISPPRRGLSSGSQEQEEERLSGLGRVALFPSTLPDSPPPPTIESLLSEIEGLQVQLAQAIASNKTLNTKILTLETQKKDLETKNNSTGFSGSSTTFGSQSLTTPFTGFGSFGTTAASSLGPTNKFGQPPIPTCFGSTPSFNFGSTPSFNFGPTSTPGFSKQGFGSTTTTTPPAGFGTDGFGSSQATGFGQSTSTGFDPAGFGSTPLPNFLSGFGSTSGFGQATSTKFGKKTIFGGSTTSAFGSSFTAGLGQTTPAIGFGQSTSTGFGHAKTGFGSNTTPLPPSPPINVDYSPSTLVL